MKNIVNIINFVRDVEPRIPTDLVTPVREQIRLARKYGLKSTFLLQYDAFIDDVYIELMKSCEDICEIGVWLETVKPQVENAGLEWRGRYPWDWHCNVGFLIGYTPEERIKIIDETMERFKSIFGYYPESVGSWLIDAVSMKYLSEKYHIKACCICRDEVGTDGYTMQGGYYNGAYYPSVNNMFCPANSAENQITMPVFRMLGSDAIYAYDYQVIDFAFGIPTLEPACPSGGGNEKWVDWFMKETFCGSGISIQYTQAGQENSFGWERMGDGLELQYPYIKKMAEEGRAEVMTLGESGKWFLDNYSVTPAQSLKAMTDWNDMGRKSVWYNSRYYRTNVMWENGVVRFRDFYIFDDMYEEKYLHTPCTTMECEYRNLPVMDGTLYTDPKSGVTAGIYLTSDGKNIVWEDISYEESGNTAKITLKSASHFAVITLNEKSAQIESDIKDLTLTSAYDKKRVYDKNYVSDGFGEHSYRDIVFTSVNKVSSSENKIDFVFDRKDYSLEFSSGKVKDDFSVVSDNGNISLKI